MNLNKPREVVGSARAKCSRWNTYRRAYTGSPDWPVILHLRKKMFLRAATTACLHLAHGIVLDVGTGPGRLPLLLAEQAPNLTCIGIDIEEVLLRDAVRDARQNQGHDRISFLKADACALPFQDQSFDAVISMFSLHLWSYQDKAVAELRRVLKDEGLAVVMVGRRYVCHRKFWPLDYVTKDSAKSMKALLHDAGFGDVEITYFEYGAMQIVGQK